MLSTGLEHPRTSRHEIQLIHVVDYGKVRSEPLGFPQPLPRRLRFVEHGEGPRAVLGQLVAQRRLIDLAEHDEGLVDRLDGGKRAIRSDLDDREHIVGVGVAPPHGDVVRHADGLRGVVTPLFEPADAAQGDGDVSVPAHGRRPPRRRAAERCQIVPDRSSGVCQTHRKMPESHRHGGAPRSVFESFGTVLGEPEDARRVGGPIELQLELRLRQVKVELLAQSSSLRRRCERSRRQSQFGIRMIASAIDGRQDGALDGETSAVQGTPRCRRGRKRCGEVARPVDTAGLAVCTQEAHGQCGVAAQSARQNALDPRSDERCFVRRGKPVEELRACRDRNAV